MPAPLDPQCLFEVLASHEVDYVLLGGLAAVLHGSPAMTNDADVMPATDRDNLRRLGDALIALEARVRVADNPDGVEFDPHPDLLASMAMLHLTTRCGDLDLAFEPAARDDYQRLRSASTVFDIDGVQVNVASLDDIIRSKEEADRPRDRAVLPVLYALSDEIRRKTAQKDATD
jgi:hypothetical protein